MRIVTCLAVLAAAVGCGDSATGPEELRQNGVYQVTGVGPGVTAPWEFRVLDKNAERIILDWTSGPVVGNLPVRDTALWNESAYRVDWLPPSGGPPMYILRITGTTCVGRSFYAFGNSTEWSGCTLTAK
jgi:hypothetical protein